MGDAACAGQRPSDRVSVGVIAWEDRGQHGTGAVRYQTTSMQNGRMVQALGEQATRASRR